MVVRIWLLDGAMAVIDVARQTVVTHSPEDSVVDAIGSMREREVSTVVVVDEGGAPMGLLTDRLVALQVGQGADLEERSLAAVDLDEPDPVAADCGIYDLLEHMAEETARRVPVVDDGELVGIISLSDVVVLLGMELQLVANVIRTSSPAYERSATAIYE
jgi:CBS domain-containing protein